MTWKEFKEEVDTHTNDDAEIDYIDVSLPNRIYVQAHEDNTFWVENEYGTPEEKKK